MAADRHDARLERWVDKVGGVTLPLLAGFSFTSVIVVSDNAAHFLMPGWTILALTVATLVLIAAVQCAYHAHIYFTEQDPDYKRAVYWSRWTRRAYDVGLFVCYLAWAWLLLHTMPPTCRPSGGLQPLWHSSHVLAKSYGSCWMGGCGLRGG
jgi:hypothetical protein